MKSAILLSVFCGVFLFVQVVSSSMSSDHYNIDWDSLNSGGDDSSSSTSYLLEDTLAEIQNGRSTSTSYIFEDGYRAGMFAQVLSFEIFSQSLPSASVADALDGTEITCDESPFSIGEYVVLIQNKGATQVSAIGRIINTASHRIYLDSLVNGGTEPVIDGSNDYVYKLSGLTANFGTLQSTIVSTNVISFNVTADVSDGYSIKLRENSNLISGANDINDVVDGVVTVASEEYGARSSDTTITTSTFDTEDTAITTSFQDIITKTSTVSNDRSFLTLKAAVSTSSVVGAYSQSLTFILSANY